jgi:hypothetical protein
VSEVNPNHPVTASLHDYWHKIVAVILHKLEIKEVVITAQDVVNLQLSYLDDIPSVLAHDQADGIHIRIVSGTEAQRLAKKEGGLPV